MRGLGILYKSVVVRRTVQPSGGERGSSRDGQLAEYYCNHRLGSA